MGRDGRCRPQCFRLGAQGQRCPRALSRRGQFLAARLSRLPGQNAVSRRMARSSQFGLRVLRGQQCRERRRSPDPRWIGAGAQSYRPTFGGHISRSGRLSMRLSGGSSARLGASWDGRGTNFALFSANAQKVELCLFDGQGRRELERIELPERTEDVWHGSLTDVSPGQLYVYRVHGPYEPERGYRFNAHKLLVDPYAQRLVGRIVWSDAHFGYRAGSARADLSFDRRDNARGVPKAVVTNETYTLGPR